MRAHADGNGRRHESASSAADDGAGSGRRIIRNPFDQAEQAGEEGHDQRHLQGECELHKGVLGAGSDAERGERLRRLAAVEARHEPLPLDTPAARNLGRYLFEAKRDQRSLRVRDAIIAATARAHGLAVLTRDADFSRFDAELIHLEAE